MRIKQCTVKMVKEDIGDYDVTTNKVISPETCDSILRQITDIHYSTVEKLGMFTLNTKNEIIGIHTLTIGTVNSSLASPRDIIQHALLNNASAIILWHNHPSGDSTPSNEDILITKKIKEACDIMTIKLLDHIIVGDKVYSMLENGRL